MDAIRLTTWDGDPNTFYANNLKNFKTIADFIDTWNSSDDDYFEEISIVLDTKDYSLTNRNAFNQFLDNAKKINTLLDNFIDKYRVTDYDYVYQTTAIPKDTDFNRIDINTYWQAINAHFEFLVGQVNDYLG